MQALDIFGVSATHDFRPVFKGGAWHFPRPAFDSVPPPNAKIVIVSFPVEFIQFDGEWIPRRNSQIIQTPSDYTKEKFICDVQFWLGYNYAGWLYASH